MTKTKKLCGAKVTTAPGASEDVEATCELHAGHRGGHVARISIAGLPAVLLLDQGSGSTSSDSYFACASSYGDGARVCSRTKGHGGNHRGLGRSSKTTPEEYGVVYEWSGSGRTGATMLPIGNAAVQLRGKPPSNTVRAPKKRGPDGKALCEETAYMANLRDTGATSEGETSEGLQPLRIVWSQDDIDEGRCGLLYDGHGAPCQLSAGHDGQHKSAQATWRQVLPDDRDCVPDVDDEDDDVDRRWDPEEDGIRTGAERDLARQLREDREAHAAALDRADTPPAAPSMIARTGETITCRGRVYRVHPAARLFPTPAAQYEKLKDSIARKGQKHAVEVIDVDDTVIDGCSRLRACDELGIDPIVKRISVADPIAYVIAVNLERRHLDASLCAVAAADLATLDHGANQHSRGPANLPVLTQAEAAGLLGVSERSVRDAVRVKNAAVPEVAAAVREGSLKVAAGAELAKLDKSAQVEEYTRAARGSRDISIGKVRKLVQQRQKREVIERINDLQVGALPSGPYGVIYADPPWRYSNSDQHEGSRGHVPYPTMSREELLALRVDIDRMALPDCVLALWTTNAFFPLAVEIVEAWGFAWGTVVTWDKGRPGLGVLPRGQTEHLIIALRGEPVHTLAGTDGTPITTIARAPAGEHSEKPELFADILKQHCSGPHVELWARTRREGWSVWGAEADGQALAAAKKSKILTATDARARRGA